MKAYFKILMQLVNVGLLISAAYYGLWVHDYPQACFNLLLVLVARED